MLTIGASHRTATSEMLGDYGRAAESLRTGLRDGLLGRDLPVRELAILSTCARVEIYAVADDSAREEAARFVGREVFGAAMDASASRTPYRLTGPDTVRHLCRVASGLDSFVLGEHEIAGQVQRAFRDAIRLREGASVLENLAAAAKRASSRVRSETGLGRHPVSVSSVAVDIAHARLGGLSRRHALVVGAGEAGLLVARSLRAAGVGEVTVVNRSIRRARRIAAEVDARAAELSRLDGLLAEADVVMTATGAQGVVVDATAASRALDVRGGRAEPLVILDLALPGDVDPAVRRLRGVELLTLEDVKSRVRRHLWLRREELGAAERVVGEVVDDFVHKQESPAVETVIGELRRSIEAVRSSEVDRWLARRESEVPPSRDELDHLTRSIVNKLLHEPMRRLRAAPVDGECRRPLVRAARELVGDTSDERPAPGG